MYLALITALGVGGATIAGVLIGFLFQKVPHRFNDIMPPASCWARRCWA